MHAKQKQCIQLGRIPKVCSLISVFSITVSKQMPQDMVLIIEPASASELVLGPDAVFGEVVADVGLGGDKKFL